MIFSETVERLEEIPRPFDIGSFGGREQAVAAVAERFRLCQDVCVPYRTRAVFRFYHMHVRSFFAYFLKEPYRAMGCYVAPVFWADYEIYFSIVIGRHRFVRVFGKHYMSCMHRFETSGKQYEKPFLHIPVLDFNIY